MFIVREDTGSSRVRNCVQERGSQGTRLHSDMDIIDGQRGHTRATPSDERLHSRLHDAVVSGGAVRGHFPSSDGSVITAVTT